MADIARQLLASRELCCAACEKPLSDAPDAITTLPCAASIHRACLPTDIIGATPDGTPLFACPVPGCRDRRGHFGTPQDYGRDVALVAAVDLLMAKAAAPTDDIKELDWDEFEDALSCPLCYLALAEPVTLDPCGHTGCRTCVLRSLDHVSDTHRGLLRCFVCRTALPASYPAYLSHPANIALTHILATSFPAEVAERTEHLRQEIDAAASEAAAREDADPVVRVHRDRERTTISRLPLFVCNLAFPGQSVPLHLFEPRYRLMLRRITAEGGSRYFGMLMYHPQGGIPTLGTLMRVNEVEFLPDGRALVDTTGAAVFAVTGHVATGDGGYLVAETADLIPDSEHISPQDPIPGYCAATADRLREAFPRVSASQSPPRAYTTIQELSMLADAAVNAMIALMPPQHRTGARAQFGPVPVNDPHRLGYWLGRALPVPEHVSYALMMEDSPRERIVLAFRWMETAMQRTGPDNRNGGVLGRLASTIGCPIQ